MTGPTSIWQGDVTLFGVTLKCHVLDNGQRIIEADSVAALLNAMADESSEVTDDEVERFVQWQKGWTQ